MSSFRDSLQHVNITYRRGSYRMNIFGFLGNPHSPASLALMDRRLAVEWVRDNIHAFGGDPSRIILFGQSAGGGSIDLYSYAYTSDPIISGMILQSGTTSLGAYTQETAAKGWYNVTSTLNCSQNTTNSISLMACMRNKTTSDITSAMPQFNAATGAAYFWPTIDEILVFSDGHSRSTAGKFIKVPILIGNTDYEAGYLKAMSSAFDAYLPDEHWDVFNLQVYTCPSAERAKVSVFAGLSTWRYRYSGDFEELALTRSPRSRAYHASELVPLFGAVDAFEEMKPSGDLIEVGRYLRGAWAAFAKDPERGVERYGWPRYRSGRRTLIGWIIITQSGQQY
ncbi:MAG: hypothetical protein CL912_08300 [Deltaproteobacteria bacterium]|nr:hypothetical protein [Deltaproteobacteria bacterium]